MSDRPKIKLNHAPWVPQTEIEREADVHLNELVLYGRTVLPDGRAAFLDDVPISGPLISIPEQK